mgnify:CR=1 FL=1
MAQNSQVSNHYNSIAREYDLHDNTNQLVATDKFIYGFIQRHGCVPNIIDLGCGTGRSIDWLKLMPHEYYGIDISEGMLEQFKINHPGYRCEKKDIYQPDILSNRGEKTAISLYGSPCYTTLDKFIELTKQLWANFLHVYLLLYGVERNAETFEAQSEMGILKPLVCDSKTLYHLHKEIPTLKWKGIDRFKKKNLTLSVPRYYINIGIDSLTRQVERFAWVMLYK